MNQESLMWAVPETLKINGKVFDVEFDDEMDDNHFGSVLQRTQKVKLNSRQHIDSMADTLLHEALHVISEHCKLELGEDKVSALASQLIGFFRDNQETVALFYGNYVFENEWQSFRTKKDRSLELTSVAHECPPGRRKIAVKVVDIFGNDTMTIVEVRV